MQNKIGYYLDEIDNLIQGKEQYPITCEIDPSNRCQNFCSFCMYKDYREQVQVDLEMKIFISLIMELKELDVRSITFTGGGEPTVHKQFLEMAYLAHKLGFQIGLVTNGINLHLLGNNCAWFRFIRVSIDAATFETHEKIKKNKQFNQIIKNIEHIVSIRKSDITTVGLSFVVCPENKHEVESASSLATQLKVDYIQFKPVYGQYDIIDTIEETKSVIKTERYRVSSRLPCHIAGLIGVVGADANVYYCCQHRGEDEFIVGNLYTDSFKNIWQRRNRMNPPIDNCLTCRYMNYAKGYELLNKPEYAFLRHKLFL